MRNIREASPRRGYLQCADLDLGGVGTRQHGAALGRPRAAAQCLGEFRFRRRRRLRIPLVKPHRSREGKVQGLVKHSVSRTAGIENQPSASDFGHLIASNMMNFRWFTGFAVAREVLTHHIFAMRAALHNVAAGLKRAPGRKGVRRNDNAFGVRHVSSPVVQMTRGRAFALPLPATQIISSTSTQRAALHPLSRRLAHATQTLPHPSGQALRQQGTPPRLSPFAPRIYP